MVHSMVQLQVRLLWQVISQYLTILVLVMTAQNHSVSTVLFLLYIVLKFFRIVTFQMYLHLTQILQVQSLSLITELQLTVQVHQITVMQ